MFTLQVDFAGPEATVMNLFAFSSISCGLRQMKWIINHVAMGRARFIIYPYFLTVRPWAERGSRFTLDLFLFFNHAAMVWARFIIYPYFFLTARPWAERGSRFTLDLFSFFNRAAMGRARFLIYPWFIFIFYFFRVERPRSPLGRTKDSCESRNLRCLFPKSF